MCPNDPYSMRNYVVVLWATVLVVGCRKHDVDIASLNTNPFDADWRGTSFLHVDSIRTLPVGQGVFFQQRVYLRLSPELRGTPDCEVRLIEITVPDTASFAAGNPDQENRIYLNQQVMLGTEYCYQFDLSIGGAILMNHRVSTCAIAEL